MQPRLDPMKAAPEQIKALFALEETVRHSDLEPALVELVRMRASQINGCAYCLSMHSRDALARGETAERLFLLDAWREAPMYTPRERAALAWTEAITLIATTHAPDADYEEARRHFDEAEMVKLTLLIAAINAWNRFGIGFRAVPVHAKAPQAASA